MNEITLEDRLEKFLGLFLCGSIRSNLRYKMFKLILAGE